MQWIEPIVGDSDLLQRR